MSIIGISCFYHDSAAALVSNEGKILAAAQEERFTRNKHDSRFPICAIDYCINEARKINDEIEAYIYYEKPIRIFMRLLETYFNTAPRGFSSFKPAMQSWIGDKLFTKNNLIEKISKLDSNFDETKLFFSDHHLSHASSAFFPSYFDKSVILCMDAVGEWVTTSAWLGNKNEIKPILEINFPDSLGMLYSAFTYYCGFKVNSGEYKLMGLAPFGKPIYKDKIIKHLIDIKDDGSFKLNMEYFKFHRGLKMISKRFIKLFGKPPRNASDSIDPFYMDVAASIQEVTEEIIIKITKHLRDITGFDNLCLAGGVALNCVANGKILKESGFKKLWIQPAAGDAGNALGAALSYLYLKKKIDRKIINEDSMNSAYLGPSFTNDQIKEFLNEYKVTYKELENDSLVLHTARKISEGSIVGWFQGRMEFGPRALGNRSILGDPRVPEMQKIMNIKIKNRESFRPFAPVILEEFKKEYFDLDYESPYMLQTKKITDKFIIQASRVKQIQSVELVNEIRSNLPAITHVDYSCRVQTVSKKRNKLFYDLLSEFYKITKSPVLINTSFNVRGEPIVASPEDALRCFVYTNIDILVLGNIVVSKKDLPIDIKNKINKPLLIED
tara:strand:- start:6093 stop:7925 length:1833 start_codon:yes stop_codon:yes gene_type:complete